MSDIERRKIDIGNSQATMKGMKAIDKAVKGKRPHIYCVSWVMGNTMPAISLANQYSLYNSIRILSIMKFPTELGDGTL